ncbi:hypothetical protein MNBD_GAMMA11-2028 [hydrothermal vent metagenome]|uniref:Uncharacterized protein n=1 Tax=hydrothermal vent metagenome TaxID=652676 RepID=A0A3B0WU81_9ZZZZ
MPLPEPAGMSESPVFVLHNESGDNNSNVISVAGIFTPYRDKNDILSATDIQHVLNAINQYEK